MIIRCHYYHGMETAQCRTATHLCTLQQSFCVFHSCQRSPQQVTALTAKLRTLAMVKISCAYMHVYGGFHNKWGYPKMDILETPIKMDGLGVPLF